jgi:hypothetical protein
MRVVNPSTWRFTYKNNSEAIGTEIWVLAANRKSMTRTYSGRHENGEEFSQATTLKRTGGTAGFEGTWESTQMNLSFSEIDIAPNGDNGISTHVVADETKYSLHFDGKEYPEVGPRIPAGLTISARMAGARSAKAVTRLNGKVFDAEEWEVSTDGKTFTYSEQDAGVEKAILVVMHRLPN